MRLYIRENNLITDSAGVLAVRHKEE